MAGDKPGQPAYDIFSTERTFFSSPENDSFRKDFCFTADVLLQREVSEMRGPTGVKFCMLVAEFYNAGPKFWSAHPKKISGSKNMQNLARFRTTSKFGGEYLRNG